MRNILIQFCEYVHVFVYDKPILCYGLHQLHLIIISVIQNTRPFALSMTSASAWCKMTNVAACGWIGHYRRTSSIFHHDYSTFIIVTIDVIARSARMWRFAQLNSILHNTHKCAHQIDWSWCNECCFKLTLFIFVLLIIVCMFSELSLANSKTYGAT